MVSQLGFWGQYVGVGWEARTLTSSDFLVALAFAAQWLPALLLSSLAGVFADRYDRRKLVLYGNVAMVLPPLAVGLLIQLHAISMTRLIALVFLGGVGQAFTQPAASAFVSALVPMEDLHSAVALNAGMSNSTRVIGPTLAGGIIAAWGVAWGFHINAVSFLAVAGACAACSIRPTAAPKAPTSVLVELKLGLRYTRENKAVGRLLLLMAFSAFFIMHAALMPIFARDVLHGGVSTYGLLSAAPGLGTVGAAWLTTALGTARQQRAMLVGSSIVLSIAVTTFAISRHVPLSVVALGGYGFAWMILTTTVNTMLIAATDDEYRGRVMGVYMMCAIGAFPINSVVGGLLANVIGAPGTVLLCGISLSVCSIVFYASGSLSVIRGRTEHVSVMVRER